MLVLLGTIVATVLIIVNADILKILSAFAVVLIAPLFVVRPKAGFIALLIARPLIDMLGQRVSFNIQNVLIINLNAIFGIFVVGWGIFYLLYKRTRVFRIPVFYPLALLVLATLASIIFTRDPITVFGETIRIASYVVIFLLGFEFTKNLHDVRTITTAIFASSISPVVIGLYQLITKTGLADEASSNRILGTFAHPSLFGHYLAALMILALALMVLFPLYKRTYGVLFLFYGFLLVFTFSRAGWGYAVIGVALLSIVFFREHFARLTVLAFGTLFAVVALGLFLQAYTSFQPTQISIVSRLLQTAQLNPDTSVTWRFQFWNAILGPAQEHLLKGYGGGTFIQFAENEINTSFDAHNDYLKLLVELGVAGLAAFIGFFAMLSSEVILYLKRASSQKERVLVYLILAETLGMMFVSFFDNLYQNTTLYWILLAMFGSIFHVLQNQKHLRNIR